MSIFEEEDWQSSEKERSRLVKDNGPKVDTTRLPQMSSTADYPKNINVVPMGSTMAQVQEFALKDPKTKALEQYRPPLTAFEQELRRLLNRFSMENHSNTPDNILAEYLSSCLNSFNVATGQREQWYGRKVF